MRSLFLTLVALSVMLIVYVDGVSCQTIVTPGLARSVVTIKSDPPEAGVRVDSGYAGKTPITISLTRGTSHALWIHKQGYLPFQCVIGPLKQDSLSFSTTLDPLFGTLTIFAGGPDHWISVDGKELGKDRVDSLVLPLGVHHLTIKDPRFEREVSQAVIVDQQRHMAVIASFGTVSVPRLFTSLLLPGYAQLDDGASIKGVVLSVAGAGTLGLLISAILNYNDTEKGYRDALFRYDLATTEYAATQARVLVDRRFAEYETARSRMRVSLAGVGVVWLVNALDVAFNHALKDRIEVFADAPRGQEYRISLALRLP